MMKNPKKRHIKKALKELTKLTAATVQLLPMDHFKTASGRLSMRLPNLTSTTPLTSQEAYDVLWGGIDAELASGMDRAALPLGLSDPSRAKDRDHTKLAIKATPEQVAEMGEDLTLIFKDGVAIDRTTHPVVTRPNPIRQHWERFGDQSDLRPVPGNVDELLDKGANPELRQHLTELLKFDPEEDKE
jgi:hypothetical protein